MKIFDPIYKTFDLSENASRLVMAPEVRRLSQVRLLNSLTPTLATLGDLRRYSHTLGVLRLFSIWRDRHGSKYSTAEMDALEAAIILHDVATPPFGHIFEYLLKEQSGWDHEAAASEIVLKRHVRLGSGHQIFAGATPQILKLLDKLKIEVSTVIEILGKRHKLHPLIMGTLDFDNIDNVFRMAWALGISDKPETPSALASEINVNNAGKLSLKRSAFPLLESWARTRFSVYQTLVFDFPTVAAQAVLTEAIRIGLEEGTIHEDSWAMNDEELLNTLQKSPSTKNLISGSYLGELPRLLFSLQLPWKDSDLIATSRKSIESTLSLKFSDVFQGEYFVYLLKERGSFSKALTVSDEMGNDVQFGRTSKSLILYVFANESFCKKAARLLVELQNVALTMLECHPEEIMQSSLGIAVNKNDQSLLF